MASFTLLFGVFLLAVIQNCNSKALEYSNLNVGDVQQMKIEDGHTYAFFVNATSDPKQSYSAFVFQAHAELSPVTLMNISRSCNVPRECHTFGLHVGMVQLLPFRSRVTYNFSVDFFCTNCSNISQELLVAVVGIPYDDPVPGGCSLTSALEIDPSFSVVINETSSTASITFLDSDEGFTPNNDVSEPLCTDANAIVTTLRYQMFQKCMKSPNTNSVFSSIKSLLTPKAVKRDILNLGFQSFKGGDMKKLNYLLIPNQVVVFNVLVYDSQGRSSAYVPDVATKCDPNDPAPCSYKISVSSCVCGPLIGLIGLFLCFLGHRFLHIEVLLMSVLLSSFVVYFVLSVATNWIDTDLVVVTIVLSLLLTAMIFTLWFFSNWVMTFLIMFALCATFLVTAAILYTPIGDIALLRLWYIYMLALLCGTLVFVLPFVCFPAVMNIVTTSMIGSYSVIFSVGLFVNSYLNYVLLNIINSAVISGYLASNGHCGLDILDTALSCAWVLLLVAGILIQGVIEIKRRAAHKKNEKRRREKFESNFRRFVEQSYSPFPKISLYKRLVVSLKKKPAPPIRILSATKDDEDERRPLMSPNPNFAPRYHGSHLQ